MLLCRFAFAEQQTSRTVSAAVEHCLMCGWMRMNLGADGQDEGVRRRQDAPLLRDELLPFVQRPARVVHLQANAVLAP